MAAIVPAKSNEITAIPQRLKFLLDKRENQRRIMAGSNSD
jgi:hypothetical protein